jgi:hypothetical protein
MRKKHLLVALAALFFTALYSKPAIAEKTNGEEIVQKEQPGKANANRKYKIKSGIITFETSVARLKGKEILYFDDYGNKELLEKYTGDKLKEVTLADGTTMYKIKPDQKTAYKMGDANRGLAYKFDWDEIETQTQETKAKKLANITVAGKDCESYTYENKGMTTTFAGWNNICLFTEQKMKMGTSVSKAVSIEEDAVIAPEKFRVPAGYEIK